MSKTILYFFVRENVTSNKYLYNLPQINEWVFVWFFLLGGGFVWFFFQFVCLFVCLSFKLFMLTVDFIEVLCETCTTIEVECSIPNR